MNPVLCVSLRKVLRAVGISSAVLITVLGLSGAAHAQVIFDSTDSPLPGNIPSLGYQANQTAEFGNEITFAGTNRQIGNVEIIMSDWANQADYPGVGDATGYDHPITLNFYNPGSGTSVGSLIASKTVVAHVPWHTANGFSGTAFPVNFDFTGVTLPDTVVFGVAYNTETWVRQSDRCARPVRFAELWSFASWPECRHRRKFGRRVLEYDDRG